MASLHLDAFCQFWFDNFNSPIPPLPQKPSDLNVTQLEQLRIYDGGKLYQNLFAVRPGDKKNPLPADLESNLIKKINSYESCSSKEIFSNKLKLFNPLTRCISYG